MTGFGVGAESIGHGKVIVEVRTVNHRHLDVRMRLPKELEAGGMFVEQAARNRLSRGRCEICVRVEGPALPPLTLDFPRARAALEAFARLRDEIAPGAEVPLSLLSTVPDLFVPTEEGAVPKLREAIERALSMALDDMDAMRAREGSALTADLRARAATMSALVDAIRQRVPEVVASHRRRLADRVKALLADTEAALDPARIDQEIALLADRTDVTEELTRLSIHFQGVEELLSSSAASGRRLDFLLQEVGREINTIGAKSQDAMIARAVVEAKSELEKMREQAQNVE
jgi:uncharacterized protein (TIGR00255 family)